MVSVSELLFGPAVSYGEDCTEGVREGLNTKCFAELFRELSIVLL